jgi:hypothetical protein
MKNHDNINDERTANQYHFQGIFINIVNKEGVRDPGYFRVVDVLFCVE